MKTSRGRFLVLGTVCLGLLPWGCSDSEPAGPVGGEPVKLSPGMEQMKEDMLNKMKKKELGKDPAKQSKKK